MSDDDPAKDVAADPADDGGPHPHLDQIDRRVGRTAADGQDHFLGRDQFARPRQTSDRSAQMVRHDDAGT